MTHTHIVERFPVESPVGWHGPYGRMAGVVKGWIGPRTLDVEYRGPRGVERFTVCAAQVIP